jgi:hypothetical protein
MATDFERLPGAPMGYCGHIRILFNREIEVSANEVYPAQAEQGTGVPRESLPSTGGEWQGLGRFYTSCRENLMPVCLKLVQSEDL